MTKINKSHDEWQKILPPKIYDICRGNGTEPPFANLYYDNYNGVGFYRCSNCGLKLFEAHAQFNSGTGWPSFFAPYSEENIETLVDPDGARIAVRCARCESHLGHLFQDGPEPTGLRYCMNSAALVFIPGTWQDN